jgi:hypothetical protein
MFPGQVPEKALCLIRIYLKSLKEQVYASALIHLAQRGDRESETGSLRQGVWVRESETGSLRQGVWDRESESGSLKQGVWDSEQSSIVLRSSGLLPIKPGQCCDWVGPVLSGNCPPPPPPVEDPRSLYNMYFMAIATPELISTLKHLAAQFCSSNYLATKQTKQICKFNFPSPHWVFLLLQRYFAVSQANILLYSCEIFLDIFCHPPV